MIGKACQYVFSFKQRLAQAIRKNKISLIFCEKNLYESQKCTLPMNINLSLPIITFYSVVKKPKKW